MINIGKHEFSNLSKRKESYAVNMDDTIPVEKHEYHEFPNLSKREESYTVMLI
jgi:hypothetical protein